MTGLSVLLLGLGLGLRHATDADHIVVISAMLQREPGPRRAAKVAALWGIGHTVAFLAVGVGVVALGLRLPPTFDRYAAMLVAAMLILLGGWHLRRSFSKSTEEPSKAAEHAMTARPVAIGLVHGLAGSAGIALIAATTIDSRLWAAIYLMLFGLGTIVGMVILTMLLSWPLTWTIRQNGRAPRVLGGIAALCSVLLGLYFVYEAFQTK